MIKPKITAGAAYNALMTEESKESLTLMVIDLLRQLREAKSLLDARQWHDDHCSPGAYGPISFNRCLNTRCIRASMKKAPNSTEQLPGEDFHFEDSQIMTMIQASEYYKTTVAHALSLLTSGEKWSLYRVVVALADAQRGSK